MNWTQWWSEHGETVWASIAALIIGLAIGYYFYRLTVRPKKVDWLPISASSILQIRADQRPNFADLELTLGGQIISNPNLILLRIVNTGSLPVTQADFDPPITFDFADVPVIRASIHDQVKKSSKVNLEKVTDSCYSLSLSSMNPGQWIDVQFITDTLETTYPIVMGEVIGRGELHNVQLQDTSDYKVLNRVAWGLVAGIFVLAIVFGILGGEGAANLWPPFAWLLYLAFIGGILALIKVGVTAVLRKIERTRAKKWRRFEGRLK